MKLTVKALREQIRSVILEVVPHTKTRLRRNAVLRALKSGPKTKAELIDALTAEEFETNTAKISGDLTFLIDSGKVVTLAGEFTGRIGPTEKRYGLASAQTIRGDDPLSSITNPFKQAVIRWLTENDYTTVKEFHALMMTGSYQNLLITFRKLEAEGVIKVIGVKRNGGRRGPSGAGKIYALTSRVESGEVPASIGTVLTNNEQKIVNTIQTFGPINTLDITYRTELDRTVVITAVSRLESMGLIRQVGMDFNQLGRKSIKMWPLYEIA